MMPSFLQGAIKTRLSFRPKGENGDPSGGRGLKCSEEIFVPTGGRDLKQDLPLRSR